MVAALIRKSADIADLKKRAKQRIPQFSFDYIEEGCNQGVALQTNRNALNAVQLQAKYLKTYTPPDLTTRLFEQTYYSPFGIAPLGLTGLVWPHTSEMHARAARKANIPFILSTVSTTSIETAAHYAEENFWFQLYPPADAAIQADLLRRLTAVGCKNLVVTVDVPTPSRRIKSIKSGLAVPPKITAGSIWQSLQRPRWSLATLRAGLPQFETLRPYIGDTSNIEDIANFVRMALRDVVDETLLKKVREQWQGQLIIKGINHVEDAKIAAALGADGIIVSNHGGRQLDATAATIDVVGDIVAALPTDVTVMVDSGVESGVDIARFLAKGAASVFAGRAFLYGVAAHGEHGAHHAIDLLNAELEQVMSQLHCAKVTDLPEHLVD